MVQKIQDEICKFQLDSHASVSDQCEQVYGEFLWNTAITIFGPTRDTPRKSWIKDDTWSTLRLVAPFRRLLYRFSNVMRLWSDIV